MTRDKTRDKTRVVVTGGAGFIGSHLTDALLARGEEVVVVDDLSTGRQDRLPAGADLVEADVASATGLAEAVNRLRPATVFHLAAQASVRGSVADPVGDAGTNVLGAVRVLVQALRHEARVVLASTAAVYGAAAEVPTPETAPPRPESPYGTAKLCAEEYVRLFDRLHGSGHAVLRLANVYGPRQDPTGESGVVSIFCGTAARGEVPLVYGDGLQTRDYLYVADAVGALLAAADRGAGGLWNVGSGTETSVLDLLDVVRAASGRALPAECRAARPGEVRRSALDCGRIEADLGWTARTGLAAGVGRTFAWIAAGQPARGRL